MCLMDDSAWISDMTSVHSSQHIWLVDADLAVQMKMQQYKDTQSQPKKITQLFDKISIMMHAI